MSPNCRAYASCEEAPCGTSSCRRKKSGWESRAPCKPSGIVPSHSGVLSFHCTHRTVFPALLPASGVAHLLSRQDVPASAGPPLQGAHLARTRRPRVLEDVRTLDTIHQPSSHSGDRRARPLPANHEGEHEGSCGCEVHAFRKCGDAVRRSKAAGALSHACWRVRLVG